MNVTIQRLPLDGTALCRAYLHEPARVQAFYGPGSPDRLSSYETAAAAARAAYPTAHWSHLSDLAVGATSAARKRLEAVVDAQGVVVVTGQQAGLFTGPCLTLYKALTAVRLAGDLQGRLDLPVMPVFWVASEDHDWAEVNHVDVVDQGNELRRIEVERQGEGPDGPGLPIHRVRLGDDIEAALDAVDQLTPDTEFKTDVMESLRHAYRPARGFADAFQSILTELLGELGLLVVQASHPFVKRATRDLLLQEWRRRLDSSAEMLRRARALEEAGFTPQVPVSEGATNLFIEGSGGRDRLLMEGEAGVLRSSGERLDDAQLTRLLDEQPERVSPGALLGPVAQATAFPVAAHVVGPGEIAYLAQSHGLFELHGVPTPVIVPRASIRLLEARVGKVLEKYGIRAEDLAGDARSAIDDLIRRQRPQELSEALDDLKAAAGRALQRVEAAATDYDPGSRSAVGSGRNAIFHSIGELEKRLDARVREKHEVMRQQLEKAATHLYPGGRPQERVLNIYPYLIRYGQDLIHAIHESIASPLG